MAVIDVNDVYVLGETGAQVDKVTGLYFKNENANDTEKAQARANIGAGSTNPNLLDNPWFTAGNVVNQRGFSSMASASGYTSIVDRWLVNSSGATLSSDGITIDPTGNDYGLIQRMERSRLIANETYTLSVVINGTLYTRTFVWNTNKYLPNFYGTVRAYIGSPNDNPFALWIAGRPGDSFTISKIKLELGSVSTLANDAPPDYGTELAKCQRYFQRLKVSATMSVGFGTMTSGAEARCTIPLPVPLRSAPTVSVNEIGSFRIVSETQAKTPTSFAYLAYSMVGVAIKFVVSSGIAELNNVSVQINSTSAYIDLSADL